MRTSFRNGRAPGESDLRLRPIAILLGLALIAAAAPAQACRFTRPLEPDLFRNAETVVVGRIAGYTHGARPFALFTLVVDETLRGRPARRLRVRWDRSVIGAPHPLPPGRYLIGLANPDPRMPPRGAYAVLQQPCVPAYILEAGSAPAIEVRRVLARR